MTTEERKIFNNGMVIGLATVGLIQTGTTHQDNIVYSTEHIRRKYDRVKRSYNAIQRAFTLVAYNDLEEQT